MPLFGQFSGTRSFGRSGKFKPLPPTISNVSNVGTGRAFNNGAITFTVTGAVGQPAPDSFNIWVINPSNAETAMGNFPGPSVTVQNLLSNTQYRLKAVAVKNFVASDPTTFNTPTLVTTVPQAPTIGTATDVGTGRAMNDAAATVTFTAGATGGLSQTFRVYTSDGTLRGTASSSPITASGIDISSNRNHAFRVTAVNSNGESAVSSNTGTILLTSTPGGPSITTTGTSGRQATFSFNVPDDGGKTVTSTRIYALSDGAEIASTTISAASGTGSLTLPEITNNAFLWAQATNANGAGGLGTSGTTIFPTGTPTLSVSRPNTLNATVTITNYNASINYSVVSASGTATRSGGTITITGTTSNAFNVTVTANQGNLYIDRSATIQVPSSTTPATITGISSSYQNGGLANFSWNPIAGAASYKCVLTGPGGSTEVSPTNGITFDGLSEGVTYSLALEAYTGATANGTLLATGNSGPITFSPSTTTTTTTAAPPTTTTTTTAAPPSTTTTTTNAPPSTTTTTAAPQGTVCTSADAAFAICNNAGPCSNGFGSGSACSPIIDFTPGPGA